MMEDTYRKYQIGQQWAYKTRLNEKNSLFTIIKIEGLSKNETVIHITIEGLKIRNPHSKEENNQRIVHLPFSKEAIDRSVTKLIEQNPNLVFSMDGYEEWKKAFEKAEAGIYTVTIAEAIEVIEKTLNDR